MKADFGCFPYSLSLMARSTTNRQRIIDHGEVFTPAWMVEAMLDLVKDETERIDGPRRPQAARQRRRARGVWKVARSCKYW